MGELEDLDIAIEKSASTLNMSHNHLTPNFQKDPMKIQRFGTIRVAGQSLGSSMS